MAKLKKGSGKTNYATRGELEFLDFDHDEMGESMEYVTGKLLDLAADLGLDLDDFKFRAFETKKGKRRTLYTLSWDSVDDIIDEVYG